MPIPTRIIQKQRLAQRAIGDLAGKSVEKLIPDLSTLSQSEAGGALRKISAGALGGFGNAAMMAGVETYSAYSNWAVEEKIAKPTYTPSLIKNIADAVTTDVEPLVGYSMAKYSQGLFVEAAAALVSGVTRYVNNYYRETVAENASRDRRVLYYQRVASMDACAFCLLIATQSRNSDWANDDGYHDHCSCSTVPVFSGGGAYRPDYYDTFDDKVYAARKELISYQQEVRPAWEADWKAQGGRMGKNLSRDFFRAYPDAAVNTENLVARIRSASA